MAPIRAISFMWGRFLKLQPAELTVISFLLMSLMGGGVLYVTEGGRMVDYAEPALVEMQLVRTDVVESRNEIHTIIVGATREGERFIDMLFTSVSALCVTGLISTDFSKFTLVGQIVVMLLVQMGGLGIIVFTSMFAMVVTQGLTQHQNLSRLLAGVLDTSHHVVQRMIKHIIMYTLLFEGSATIIMGSYLASFDSSALTGGINPWWWALFHAVSAFNNAGFGLLNNNLMSFVSDPVINIVIALLIIFGGIGYPVLIAIHARLFSMFLPKARKEKKSLLLDVREVVASPVQSKVALYVTLYLLIGGTVLISLLEWNNPILKQYSPSERVLVSFFQNVSARTAGFNTIDVGAMYIPTLILMMMLMFIGANPAGTAGGIKIPTVAVLWGYIVDWFKTPGQPVMLFRHKVSKFAVSHAIRLFFFSVLYIGIVVFMISWNERVFLVTPDPTFNFTKVLFEVFSAFGTVGLTMGFQGAVVSFSGIMTDFSKYMIILTMLVGRLGPLTILTALPWKRATISIESEDYIDAEKIQIG